MFSCNILMNPIFVLYKQKNFSLGGRVNFNRQRKKKIKNLLSFSSFIICPYCSRKIKINKAIIEHVEPISNGGNNSMHNIALTCYECDHEKKNQNLIIFLANKKMKTEELKEKLKPINEIENKIISDREFNYGVMQGKSRPGHPEGKILYHIMEVISNLKHDEDYSTLRLIALIHDTFKYKVDQTKSKFGNNHHGYFARKFAENYIDDINILNIIQYHDDAYNAWQVGKRKGNWDKANERLDNLFNILNNENALKLYSKFYYADNNTGDKIQENFEWFKEKLDLKLKKRDLWFKSRIGKRVFRNDTYCCSHCDEVYKNGIIIDNEMHAEYLRDTEAEFSADGFPLKYFDSNWEVLSGNF